MALSAQAYVIIGVYALCIIVGIIMTIVSAIKDRKSTDSQAGTTAIGVISYIISLIIMVLLITLIVYDTNCLTAGQCNTWSWVRTALYIILPIISLVLSTIALFMSFKSTNTEKSPIS
jgi:ABC-type dipeptide/oligopeptide/nickel transport system permease component